jgi:S1-C subfamily serine protease
VKYTEYDVSRDRAAAEEMVGLTGQMGVPVIVIDGQAVIGFNRPRIQQLLAAGNNHQHPHLGLKVTDASSVARKPGEPPVFGALVGSVAPSSAGEKAGIRARDIITAVNQQRINNVAELEQVIKSLSSGSCIPLTYYRDDKAIKAEIIL